jgi:hypothetical protein
MDGYSVHVITPLPQRKKTRNLNQVTSQPEPTVSVFHLEFMKFRINRQANEEWGSGGSWRE